MALPLRSSQSSWRNRTYIHTQISNNIDGLNKHKPNSTDNIEERELGGSLKATVGRKRSTEEQGLVLGGECPRHREQH